MTNIEEAPQPKVLFFQTPDKPDDVTAQVIEPPPPPITLSMGRREVVLKYLEGEKALLGLTRNVVTAAGAVGLLDGLTRIGIGLSRGVNLESAHYYFGGLLEVILGASVAIGGRIIYAGRLGRLELIRDRWVQKKINQISLDQPSALVGVAPQEG